MQVDGLSQGDLASVQDGRHPTVAGRQAQRLSIVDFVPTCRFALDARDAKVPTGVASR